MDWFGRMLQKKVLMVANPSSASSYSAPPIIEAVIEIVYSTAFAPGRLENFRAKAALRYDQEKAMERVTAVVEPAQRVAKFEDERHYRLFSNDQADALVIAPNRLIWTRLAPYQGWSQFYDRVASDLKLATKLLGTGAIERIGMRYVNRIDVPVSGAVVRYEDYLAINIGLPPEIPSVDSYAWRVEFPCRDEDVTVVMQSAVVEPEIPNHGAFLIDIDVIAKANIASNLEGVLEKLQQMRTLKNKFFEMSILDEARAKFSA